MPNTAVSNTAMATPDSKPEASRFKTLFGFLLAATIAPVKAASATKQASVIRISLIMFGPRQRVLVDFLCDGFQLIQRATKVEGISQHTTKKVDAEN